jgi:hypothetical protein
MRRRLAAAGLALALAGCPFHARAPDPQPSAGPWAAARDSATRRYELYDGLDHRATAVVTYLDAAGRDARARTLGKWLGWTDAELTRRLAEGEVAAQRAEEFVIVLYTAKKEENDLDSPRSVWRVALVQPDGSEILPTRITALDADVTMRRLYPWIGNFDVVYSATFPGPADPLGSGSVLLLASAAGKVPLDFGSPPKKFTYPKTGD